MTNGYIAAAQTMGKAVVLGTVKYLILHVTPICNARCRFCFNADGMDERRGGELMPLEGLQNMAATIGTLPHLTLSGGEPTLRTDTHEIFRAFYQRAGTRFFTIPTNGFLPERVEELISRFVEDCPSGFFNLCLPFYGDKATFEDQMGVPDAYDKFRKTYDVIERAKQRHSNISGALIFVLNKYNRDHYREVTDLAAREFPGMPFGIHWPRGVTRERDARDVSIEDYVDAYNYTLATRKTKNRRNPFTVVQEAMQYQFRDRIASVVRGQTKDLDCKAGMNFLVIYDDGTVFPCEMIDVVGMPKGEGAPESAMLGRLDDFDYDLNALLRSERAQEVIRWIDSHPCACTWECAIYCRTVYSPTALSRLAFNSVRYMIG
jgi:MoaA/NifB/PqqE/SkfB family radical SAM enzyme